MHSIFLWFLFILPTNPNSIYHHFCNHNPDQKITDYQIYNIYKINSQIWVTVIANKRTKQKVNKVKKHKYYKEYKE